MTANKVTANNEKKKNQSNNPTAKHSSNVKTSLPNAREDCGAIINKH